MQLLAAGDTSMAVTTKIGPFSAGVTRAQAEEAVASLVTNLSSVFSPGFKRDFGILTVRLGLGLVPEPVPRACRRYADTC